MASPINHIQRRKAKHKDLEPYPHHDPKLVLLDKLVYAAALASVLLTVPQVLQVWASKSVQGISIISWSAYTFTATLWSLYGYYHKEKMLMLLYLAFALLNLLVVIGTLIYS